MDEKTQTEYHRAQIKEMLRRVPNSVNGGSYDNAVAFKKLAGQACKLVGQSNPKLIALTQMHNQLSQYYK